MIRSLLWKDAREHLASVLVLGLVGVGLMVCVGILLGLEPGASSEQIFHGTGLVILFLVPAISLLLGSLFLGSDKENGAATWLTTMPGEAWKVWGVRNGFAFLAQFGLMLIWGLFWWIAYYPSEGARFPIEVLWYLLGASFIGTAWGQWGMHQSKTVFGGFGKGLVGLVGSGAVVYGFLMLVGTLFTWIINYPPYRVLVFGFFYITVALGLWVVPMAWVLLDHVRNRQIVLWRNVPLFRLFSRFWWLSCQSWVVPGIVMGIIGLIAGFALPHWFLVWPIWSLSMGVVSGLCVLKSDQGGPALLGSLRAFRPLLWDIRILPSLLFGLILNLIPLVPLGISGLIRGLTGPEGSGEQLTELVWPGVGIIIPVGPFFLLWWCAGFGAALWCSLFLEKEVVAFVVSWGLGALVATLWVPAVLGGGLSLFWILGIVFVFWLLGRFLYRGFSSQNPARAGLLSFCLLVASLGAFSGLGAYYRTIPSKGQAKDPFSLEEIRQSLMNQPARLEDDLRRHLGDGSHFSPLPVGADLLWEMPVKQWPEKVQANLKDVQSSYLKKAAWDWKVPDTVISYFAANQAFRLLSEDPMLGGHDLFQPIQIRGIYALWEVSQGVKGSEESLAQEINRIFYLGECLRHKSHFWYYSQGIRFERFAYQLIEYQLQWGKPTEAGLVAMGKTLEEREAREKKVEQKTREIAYWLSRTASEKPSFWQRHWIPTGPTTKSWTGAFWQMADFAASAPWERERTRRLINKWFSDNPSTDRFDAANLHSNFALETIPYWFLNTWEASPPHGRLTPDGQDKVTRAIHDLTKTGIALKRFRITKGNWPKALEELSPAYLSTIPKDRFTGADLHFHIVVKADTLIKPGLPLLPLAMGLGLPGVTESGNSNAVGEAIGTKTSLGGPSNIEAEGRSLTRKDNRLLCELGTLLLWSVGPDGMDHGGHADGRENSLAHPNTDIVISIGP